MAVGSALITIALAIAAFAEGRSRADRSWMVIGLVLVVPVVYSVVVSGIDTTVLFGDPPVFDVVAGAMTLLLAADTVGLPFPIARRLRIGLHSAGWQFDRRLYALTEAARHAIEDPATRRDRGQRELPTIAKRIRALRAPDREWETVRDGWAQAWKRYAELLAAPQVSGASWEEALALQSELVERTEALRARYRAEAQAILEKRS
jgi:hypothetical protein